MSTAAEGSWRKAAGGGGAFSEGSGAPLAAAGERPKLKLKSRSDAPPPQSKEDDDKTNNNNAEETQDNNNNDESNNNNDDSKGKEGGGRSGRKTREPAVVNSRAAGLGAAPNVRREVRQMNMRFSVKKQPR